MGVGRAMWEHDWPRKRDLAALVIAAALPSFGCSSQPELDIGRTWVRDAPPVSDMQWTSDGQSLVFNDVNGRLYAIDVESRTPRTLMDGVSGFELIKTAQGDVVFYLEVTEDYTSDSSDYRLMQVPLVDGAIDTPSRVSDERTYGPFLVSPTGVAAALGGSGNLRIIDVATEAARPSAVEMPLAFSPDGARLLGLVGDELFLEDATGSLEAVPVPANATILGVTRWEAAAPAELVIGSARLLDLSGSESRPLLPGIETDARSFVGLSGEAARPDAAYVWSEDCLDHTSVGQPSMVVCSDRRLTLHRVVLETGAHEPIALASRLLPIAVSDDGRRLALYMDDDEGRPRRITTKALPELE